MSTPPIESITGGSHGIEASRVQMLGLASTFDSAALRMTVRAALGTAVLVDGDLVESAVLSPLTFATAELEVLAATTGTEGLTVRALCIEADALAVRAVVGAFEVADWASRAISESLDHMAGRALPTLLVGATPLLLGGGVLAWGYYQTLDPAERERLAEQLSETASDHPALVQHLINGGGGLLAGLMPAGQSPLGWLHPTDGPVTQPTTNDAARLMALMLGNDTDFVHEFVQADPGSGASSDPPGSVEDLMRQLARANDVQGDGRDLDGAIQIQQVGTGDDERYVVYVPGTDDMRPIPGVPGLVRDMLTNYQLLGGMDSAYGRGIHQALTDAGLTGKEVMLVGHSQGGMVSTALAADSRFTDDFTVRHVLTGGSPAAQVSDLPSSTHALHLENRRDVVPLLDGEDNPDQPHRTTVVFDDDDHGLVGNHGLDRYVGGGAAVDASDHASLRSQLDRMRADGFLEGGGSGQVRTVVISRP